LSVEVRGIFLKSMDIIGYRYNRNVVKGHNAADAVAGHAGPKSPLLSWLRSPRYFHGESRSRRMRARMLLRRKLFFQDLLTKQTKAPYTPYE
jgi:hypothetical protein